MKRRCLTAAAAVLALACSAACLPRQSDRIVVGVGLARNSNPGVEIAAGEINAAGGIGGRRLELAGLDWKDPGGGYNSRDVVTWAARFSAIPDLVAVVGHGDSATTLAAAASYNRDGIPQIVTIATNPAVTNIGVWTYRLCLSDAVQGPALAGYAVNGWGKRRIAIVYVNDDYGRGLAKAFEDRARELGAEIVGTVMHRNVLQPEDRDAIAGAVREFAQSRADLVVLFQRTEAALWTVQAMQEAGFSPDILGGDNLAQYSFARDVRARTEGIRVSQFLNLDRTNPRVQAFIDRVRAATGHDPDYAQAYAYDAIYLLRDAVEQGGPSRAAVKKHLDRLIAERTRIEGITGAYTLAPDHDARRTLYVAEIRAGDFRVLKALTIE